MTQIRIIPFQKDLQGHFESINKEWVTQCFTLEKVDQEQFEDPEKWIIAPGGAILFAEKEGEIVGTVGLCNVGGDVYELIKMGVKPAAQGQGIGMLLAKAILEKARDLGGRKVELYTHSKLESAIRIYKKLGFQEDPEVSGKYCRCDLKFSLIL